MLLLTGTLFSTGFIGLLKQTDLVKTMISIEIMHVAGIINFCHLARKYSAMNGYLISIISIILSGLVFAVVFMILNSCTNDSDGSDLLEEDT